MCDGKTTVALLGAENGIRTRDLNLGKVALYQLSYFRDGTTKVGTFSVFPNFFSFFYALPGNSRSGQSPEPSIRMLPPGWISTMA